MYKKYGLVNESKIKYFDLLFILIKIPNRVYTSNHKWETWNSNLYKNVVEWHHRLIFFMLVERKLIRCLCNIEKLLVLFSVLLQNSRILVSKYFIEKKTLAIVFSNIISLYQPPALGGYFAKNTNAPFFFSTSAPSVVDFFELVVTWYVLNFQFHFPMATHNDLIWGYQRYNARFRLYQLN